MRVMVLLSCLGAALLAGCIERPAPVTARADFAEHCAACHGTSGRGDGEAAAGMKPAPADLTQIAARAGGVFPMTQVMSTIDGYTRAGHAGRSAMPEFGAMLTEGRQVLYSDGTGAPPTPVPERLIELARYIESIQRF